MRVPFFLFDCASPVRAPWWRTCSSFGQVFKALHHASNQIVAVKIVPLEDNTGEVARETRAVRSFP